MIDAVGQMHSISVSYSELEGLGKVLSCYLGKYEIRLNPKNSLYIRQINTLFIRLMGFIRTRHKQQVKLPCEEAHQLIKLLCDSRIEDFNCLELSKFVTHSQMCKKLFGFSKHLESKPVGWSAGIVYKLKDFLDALSHVNEDGSIILELQEDLKNCTLKYQLLNVQRYFGEIIRDARNVIFIGGTMEPVVFSVTLD